MNNRERWILTATLLLIAVLTSIDIYNDHFEGVAAWHISIESAVALLALAALFYLVKDQFSLRRKLEIQQQFSEDLQTEAEKWKRVSKTYLEGLSVEIENQLNRWGLTEAEKEISFLLLKGLSLKEISNVRNTSVKTVRSQTNAIYTKSGLSGRSELAAFFLEDLLLPGN